MPKLRRPKVQQTTILEMLRRGECATYVPSRYVGGVDPGNHKGRSATVVTAGLALPAAAAACALHFTTRPTPGAQKRPAAPVRQEAVGRAVHEHTREVAADATEESSAIAAQSLHAFAACVRSRLLKQGLREWTRVVDDALVTASWSTPTVGPPACR